MPSVGAKNPSASGARPQSAKAPAGGKPQQPRGKGPVKSMDQDGNARPQSAKAAPAAKDPEAAAKAQAAADAAAAKVEAAKVAKAEAAAAAKKAEEDAAAAKAAALAAFVARTPESIAADVVAAGAGSAKAQAEFATIVAYCSDAKSHYTAREHSFKVLLAMCTCEAKSALEPFLFEHLDLCLEACDSKDMKPRVAAEAAARAMGELLSPHAFGVVLPTYLKGMGGGRKWRCKQVSCDMLASIARRSPALVSHFMSETIPVVAEVVWDTKPEVTVAAKAALKAIGEAVTSKDVTPHVAMLLSALVNLNEVVECIQELASITFVHTVDTPVLSLISPLLVRGFAERNKAVKRQCAVIIGNMAKLVDNPYEALPFVTTHLPLLAKAADEISDPEARAKAESVFEQLERIRDAGQMSKLAAPADVEAALKGALGATDASLKAAFNYCAASALVLTNTKAEEEEWTSFFTPMVTALSKDAAAATTAVFKALEKFMSTTTGEDDDDDDAEELCNCKFTLAYGSKVLLHNTTLRLKRGKRYGLLGGNESGKSTLMRAIAEGQVEGFPPATELRTVFVEADIQGEMSHLACIDYVFADPAIKACGCSREEIASVMLSVGFSEKMQNDAVSTLSGGWRMKLALSRAMLQKADILLLDEPTNHLDVMNVAWVQQYLNSLTHVTCIIVSHHRETLDICCTHMLQIEDLKLHGHVGNLTSFVKMKPSALNFFDMKETKMSFKLPKPAFLDGVQTKGKVLMKMAGVAFTYPGNTAPTVTDITVQVNMASRVACVGPNGAGKSTMIKLLTGELEPQIGNVWKHKEVKVAYVAQHAFHHIESHMKKTANEYIRWRYENGEDKEGLEQAAMTVTEEEAEALKKPIKIEFEDEKGNLKFENRIPERLTGSRKPHKNGFSYEMKWENKSLDKNTWLNAEKLTTMGFEKHMRLVDIRIRSREGMYVRSLTQKNVEEHLECLGLDREFGTHNRISALSSGQKVKVVLAAATWNQPHIIVLDEPTNYLATDALGALSKALEEYEGGVVMISHNDEFLKELCPETWVVEAGKLNVKGDAEWMKNALAAKTEFTMISEVTDAHGNVSKVKTGKKKDQLSRQELKARARRRKAKLAAGEEVSDSDDDE